MSTEATRALETDPIMERLEDQIGWYDRKSMTNQRYFRRIKIIEIAATALIPFLAAFSYSRMMLVTGGLGVVITVLEGMLHLNQYPQNWLAYRSTCESLKHEKYVYLGKAAPCENARTRCWRKGSNPWSRRNTRNGHRCSSRSLNPRRSEVNLSAAKTSRNPEAQGTNAGA
jgi:hypothetical protein